ncbi:hypothetical protein H0H87_007741 [Tephrocybe sp. NHM501043]|nr:hypothetical protein H0H87_007741 [Tephrocybe sp. NHM501043]
MDAVGIPSERTPLIAYDEYSEEEYEEDPPSIEHSRSQTSSTVSEVEHKATYGYPVANAAKVTMWLENTGSVARDHLASERTFLAYVRTSLSIASAAVALAQILSIAQYHRDSDEDAGPTHYGRRVEAWARPLGATAILIALMILIIGVARYFAIQNALVGGRFPVARVGIALMSTLFGALIIATFGVLMDVRVSNIPIFP